MKQPHPDPSSQNPPLTSEQWGQGWRVDDEDTQPRPAVKPSSAPLPAIRPEAQQGVAAPAFEYREHVTGGVGPLSWDAPLFRPGSQPALPSQQAAGGDNGSAAAARRAQQAAYYAPNWSGSAPAQGGLAQAPYYPPYAAPGQRPGYPPAYAPSYGPVPVPYGYGGYPGLPWYNGLPAYPWQPPQPKRDRYQFAVAITALVSSILVMLGGLIVVLFLLVLIFSPTVNRSNLTDSQYFSALLTFTALVVAGVVGGAFSLYHSIRALLRKHSARFRLPPFWIFVILYLVTLGVGFWLQNNGQEVAMPFLTVGLIALAALLPALALLALGNRLLHSPEWPTTWRRLTLALTSGATLGIGLALLLELGLLFLVVAGQRAVGFSNCLNDPGASNCQNMATFNLIFIVVAVMGPLVEETVKPLAVALYIGRVRSAAEAFVLGMACGVGFDLVETVGYIGSGYHGWLNVAIERTGAGLLHGFGAAMVSVGWYYLVSGGKWRVLKALGFWLYAVFQHFVWNGTAVLGLLPLPMDNWNLNLGFTTLNFYEIVNIIEAILILVFFIYMARRLRKKPAAISPPKASAQPEIPVRV